MSKRPVAVAGRRLLAVAAAAGTVALLAGCGGAARPLDAGAGARSLSHTESAQALLRRVADAAGRSTDAGAGQATTVRIRTSESRTVVFNANSAHAFTLVGTAMRTTIVTSRSAAQVVETGPPPRFATAASAAAWRLSGTPDPIPARATVLRLRVGAGKFGFLPEGTPLTYSDVMRLPPDPATVARAVRAHTPTDAQGPALLLRQYAFLLGRAPVTGAVRGAILRAMADLPGIRLCAPPWGRLLDVCLDEADDRYEALLDSRRGALVAVQQRILASSPLFPTLPPGFVVERDAFSVSA